MSKKKTETTPTGDRIQLSVFDVAIYGGKVLPEGEQGPLDTLDEATHPLHDIRLQTVKMTDPWVQSFSNGVMTDIEVTYLDGGKVPFVVDGRERTRGARLYSRQTGKQLGVWCQVVTLKDADLLLRGLLKNMHHGDTVPVKISKAKQAIAAGLTPEQFAPAMGVTPETIKTWQSFDKKATDEVKAAVMSGDLSYVTGAKIARLPKDEQPKALAAVMAIGKKKKPKPSNDGGDDEGDDNVQGRGGSTSAEDAAIADALGERPVVQGKKGLKALLRSIQEIKLPKNAPDRLVGFWAGCEELVELLLRKPSKSEESKLLDALVRAGEVDTSTPEPDDEDEDDTEETPEPTPAPKKRKAKAPPEQLAPPIEEPKKETVRQRQIREAAEAKKAGKKAA